MKYLVTYILLLLGLFTCAQSLPQRLDLLLTDSLMQTGTVGMMVYDLTADETLYAHNEHKTLRPASTMKLSTAITALKRLGPSYRFTTRLLCNGFVNKPAGQGGVLTGNLVAVGGMDPLFDAEDMKAFAEAVHEQHIDTIYGQLLADRSFKDDRLLGSGWCWDDDNPVLTPLLFEDKDEFIDGLGRALHDAGIVVVSDSTAIVRHMQSISHDETQKWMVSTIATRHHAIDELLVPMMKDSNNQYAECLFYQLAAPTGSLGTASTARESAKAIEAMIDTLGLTPSDYRIADGSGLSLYNYQSAELQVSLLRYAYAHPDIYAHLLAALPIAGVDGTLKGRMTQTKAAGNVHAKTGTLTGVSSLSGYLTAANGHQYCFAIIVNGMLKSAVARAFQDQVCITLCE